MSAVELSGVRKTFGRTVALERIDLRIEPGTFVGLIGHNGAGKSTCLQLLAGLLPPTEGTVRVAGIDVQQDPAGARARMGVVLEEPGLYEWLTAREWLDFVAEVHGSGDRDRALALADLGADADRPIREYSQGMRRRAALATALLHDPQVILLDEALNGLDPPSAARVKQILRALVDAGRTVILSTHVVETVQLVADRVVMLAHGRIVADVPTAGMTPADLEELFVHRIAVERERRDGA
jgi:ABC-2 type transport system ATP-binding protein